MIYNNLIHENNPYNMSKFVLSRCELYNHKRHNLLNDTNIIDNIGYIHLDAEGLEYKIIKGSRKIIEKFNPIISFEQHLNIDNYNELINHLKEKKYTIFMIDEIMPGCRDDCRNFFAFPCNVYNETLIENINTHIGRTIMILY